MAKCNRPNEIRVYDKWKLLEEKGGRARDLPLAARKLKINWAISSLAIYLLIESKRISSI